MLMRASGVDVSFLPLSCAIVDARVCQLAN
jgi:hypothetical protein